MATPISGSSTGPSVDRAGTPVVDPTENVRLLTEAATRRQDDLREASERLHGEQIQSLKDMAELRAKHSDQLNEKESSRLDAIRQVDVLAVSAAAAQTLAAVTTLATTTSANAENIRLAVVNQATTIATQLSNTVTAINERLAALERSSYEGKGKSEYQEPVMGELVAEVRKLRELNAVAGGSRGGSAATIAYVISAISVIGLLATLAFNLAKASGH